MDISVTEFKSRCLDLIRKVEQNGQAITIRRRGQVVARLEPATSVGHGGKPWEELRALGGRAYAEAGESVWVEVIAVNELSPAFHGDPADRMIVATARAHDLPLATHDKAIRKSRLVKIWKP